MPSTTLPMLLLKPSRTQRLNGWFQGISTMQKRTYNPYNSIDRQTFRIPWMYTEHAHKGHGWPLMWVITATKPSWQPHLEQEHHVVARDEYGVPMQIPPEISTAIQHVYYVPPQYFPFLKKLGDDTAELMPYMEKLIEGRFTREDYEEMFYRFAKPLKIYRRQVIMPYRSVEEMLKSPEVNWEGAWLSYRQRVAGEFFTFHIAREWLVCMLMAGYMSYLWIERCRAYRISCKLFYLEAPEHKINWVRPRGDR